VFKTTGIGGSMGEKGNDVVSAGASGGQSVVSRITETTVSTATDLAGDTGDAVKAAVIGSAVARGTAALGDRAGSEDDDVADGAGEDAPPGEGDGR
jgi:hypothetical protein